MTGNTVITLWHFDEDTGNVSRKVFRKVYCDFKAKISKNGIKQKGFYASDSVVIRIPTDRKIDVFPGDYVRMGEFIEDTPDRTRAMKVIEVSDNRRGGAPHWRLSCGG